MNEDAVELIVFEFMLSLFPTDMYSSTVEIGEKDQPRNSKVSSEKEVEGEFEEVIKQVFN